MKNNNTSNRNYNSDTGRGGFRTQNHNQQQGSQHDNRRKQQDQHQNQSQSQTQQQPHQAPNQDQHQQARYRDGYRDHQRDRSGQRNQGGQYPDSSMGNRGDNPNLGSIRFSPGFPTRELPPIETKLDPHKKFTGRCRLFVGNLAHNTSEEKLRKLFEQYGEVGEVYLGPKSAFAFIKMDTRQNAEAARDALDCSIFENRTLRVRLAAHAAAIRIKHLPSQVTNELLAYAFRYFGEVERAVVVVDDKGKSIGEGVVEYSKKQSALYAIKRCQQECFMLTASPRPVLVEPFDQQDEDEGLPEKSINKNSIEFKEQRDVGPRFAEQGTFEQTFGLKWKELYEVEKQKRDRLEQEIQEARKNLQDQIEFSRLEHDTMQLRNRLQQLEGDRLKLQQLKESTMSDAQQREEQRRQQDMLIRQREEDILRRQQIGDLNGLNQQEASLRMQASALQDILNSQERSTSNGDAEANQTQQNSQQTTSQVGSESDAGMPMNQLNMVPPQIPNQPRTFADAAMMGLNPPPYYPMQPPIGMAPQVSQASQPNLFTTFMPQAQPQQMHMSGDMSQGGFPMMSQQQQQPAQTGGFGRPQKFNRQYNNQSNNINLSGNGNRPPRKRGRF